MPQILIVDDSEADILFARHALASRTEWTVASAQDGEQALEMLTTDSFDVVVSDIRMPRIDGLQLLRQIRQRFIEIPVIITTSHGSEEIAMQAIQAGAASYVPKSNVVRELLEVVESVISSSILRKNQSRFLACVAQQAMKIVLPNNDRKFLPTVVSELQSLATAIGLTNSSDNTQLGVALEESLVNAVVHGNLEVSSDLRQRNDDSYAELIEERRNMEPYKDRVVTVTVSLTPEEGQFTIRDDGPGFDVNNLPDPTDPENLLKPSGRGIMLINAFMDEVSFNAKGNEIRLTKRRLPDDLI
ncbi:MAG: response regulator [Fuerstiella sp.]